MENINSDSSKMRDISSLLLIMSTDDPREPEEKKREATAEGVTF